MAGNGWEWTRTPADVGDTFPPRPPLKPFFRMAVCGRPYYSDRPFRFDTDTEVDSIDFLSSDPAVGFRVVVEP
jgi:hypothetical protein